MAAQLKPASRSHGIAGIVAGVLFGVALTSSKLPGGNTTPGDFTAWFDTRSHQVGGIVLSYLLAVVALTFAWFFVGLERRVRSASGDSSSRLQLAGLTGAVVVAGLLLSAGAAFGMAGPLALEHGAKAGEATVALGWLVLGLLVVSMLAAGVTITALSLDGRRNGALPDVERAGRLRVCNLACRGLGDGSAHDGVRDLARRDRHRAGAPRGGSVTEPGATTAGRAHLGG